MVQRIVLIKLEDAYTDPARRQEVAEHSREVLPTVPGVRSVSVGVPADEASAGSWDLCLTVGFDDVEAIPAYARHPVHRTYVDDYLRPKMEHIRAWNFSLSD